MFGVMQDITERKTAETRQRLLTHELEHRIKNILAMVSAIAGQTLRGSDIDTARAAFVSRLRALARAHDLLTETRWTAASMRGVLEAALAAHTAGDDGRVTIAGPDLDLTPKMALSLALGVNELATNAAKYGALSVDGGRVDITWAFDTGPDGVRKAVWTWREQGGPPVAEPTRRGFGSILITRVLAADFGGEVRIDYPPEGVTCVLTMPLVNLPQVV
jgi:two-component sensor histidine kinase